MTEHKPFAFKAPTEQLDALARRVKNVLGNYEYVLDNIQPAARTLIAMLRGGHGKAGQKWKIAEIAKACGVSSTTISGIVRDRYTCKPKLFLKLHELSLREPSKLLPFQGPSAFDQEEEDNAANPEEEIVEVLNCPRCGEQPLQQEQEDGQVALYCQCPNLKEEDGIEDPTAFAADPGHTLGEAKKKWNLKVEGFMTNL